MELLSNAQQEGRRHCLRSATGGVPCARGWAYTADAVYRKGAGGTNPAPAVGVRVDSLTPGEKGAAAHLAANRRVAGRGAVSAGTGGLWRRLARRDASGSMPYA